MLDNYVSIEAQQLKIGDVIIHIGQNFEITKFVLGKGAGSFDFGEYIEVEGKYTSHINKWFNKTEKFWLYRRSPILLKK